MTVTTSIVVLAAAVAVPVRVPRRAQARGPQDLRPRGGRQGAHGRRSLMLPRRLETLAFVGATACCGWGRTKTSTTRGFEKTTAKEMPCVLCRRSEETHETPAQKVSQAQNKRGETVKKLKTTG